MRVTFVTPGLTPSGGTRVVVEFANRLADRGHNVAIVGLDTRDHTMHRELRSDVRWLQVASAGGRYLSATNAMAGVRLALAAPSSDVIVATYTPTVLPALIASRVLRRGKAVWLHQDFPEQFSDRPLFRWLLSSAPPRFDKVVTISKWMADNISEISGARATLVGEGISHPELFLRQQWSGPGCPSPVVTSVCDPRPWKGLEDLVAAFDIARNRVQELRATILSSSNRPAWIPEWLEWLPASDRGELAGNIARSTLFVSSSWTEGFGLPPLEAMACGVPVLLTDSGGVRDYARHMDNCVMTPPRDPNALASRMVELLSSRNTLTRIAQAGRETARSFTWDGPAQRFENVLQAVTDA